MRVLYCITLHGIVLYCLLKELRYCFYLAEQERRGGLSSHASPLALPSDIAALVQEAGFALPTVDVDKIKVLYICI